MTEENKQKGYMKNILFMPHAEMLIVGCDPREKHVMQ